MQFKYNSTIGIKSKACKSCGKVAPVFSKGRCAQCSKVEDTQKRMEAETDKVIQEEDLSGLIEDADIIFSRFIRLKYANERGLTKCYTCGVEKHWTFMQNGHFVNRAHLRLRWDERNCKPQCPECNEIKKGNIGVYRERLERDGESPEILFDEMRLVHKPTREEIRQIVAEYTPKVKQLIKKIE